VNKREAALLKVTTRSRDKGPASCYFLAKLLCCTDAQPLLQAQHQLAKRELPGLVKKRTAEDNLWLALASLAADKRLQLQAIC